MILQSLCELYDRLSSDARYKVAPPGYSLQKITFKVVLHPNGKLHAIEDARIFDAKKPAPRMVLVPGGAKATGQGLNPCLLWDQSGYLLGYRVHDDKPERTAKAFAAFREKHVALEHAIEGPGFKAVCRFLESWDPARASDHPVLGEMKNGFGVFQVVGEPGFVHDEPAVKRWWTLQEAAQENDGPSGQCLVTGEQAPLARIHEPKIRGVWGGATAGTLLVSFNKAAYESYGQEQSFNAPVSRIAAFSYATALSALLDGPMRKTHRIQVGDSTVVFWTERPTIAEDIFAVFAQAQGTVDLDRRESQDEALRDKLSLFLDALRRGREAYGGLADDPDHTKFFILGLAPNEARLSVRFFHQSSIAELVDNLRRHFADIGLQPQPASGKRPADTEFPSAQQLLDETCPPKDRRPDRDKVPPILAGPLMRSILQGAPYPLGLAQAVLRRIRADRVVNYARCCTIKGYLKRNLGKEIPMSLDVERTDVAYRLGRLFAALEKTQRDIPGGEHLNATIRDRFYGSASATPGAVFPRLLRTYQHHLAKMEGGYKIAREKLVQEIVAPLTTFPAHFGLVDQGLFAIGYYHQQRAFYAKRDAVVDEPVSEN